MADPFLHVRGGESVKFHAVAWNAMLDVAKAYRDTEFNVRPGAIPVPREAAIIKIRNDTGTDLTWRSVVGLAGPVFTPDVAPDEFLRGVVFSGVVPSTTSHTGRFAVLIDPVPTDGVARAWVGGVCQAKVNLLDLGHDRADVASSDTTQLVSGVVGAAQILWYESMATTPATGSQWAVVRLGAPTAGDSWFKLTAGLVGASGTPWTPHSASADRVQWNGSSWTTVQAGATVWTGNEKSIDSLSLVYCTRGSDGRWWVTTPDKCVHLS